MKKKNWSSIHALLNFFFTFCSFSKDSGDEVFSLKERNRKKTGETGSLTGDVQTINGWMVGWMDGAIKEMMMMMTII